MDGVLSAVFGAVASCVAVHIGFAFIPGFDQWLHSAGASLAGMFGIEHAPHVHTAFAGAAGVAPVPVPAGHFCPADALLPAAVPAVPAVSPGGLNTMDILNGGPGN